MNIFKPRHKVVSVHLLPNGEILTHVLKTEFKVVEDPEHPDGYKIEDGEESLVYFKSKAVVIASGAKQAIDPRVLNEWFPNEIRPEILIPSDDFLKKDVYLT